MQGIARSGFYVFIVIDWAQFHIICIGTDILEVETVEPELRITTPFSSIKVGEEVQFEAVYFNDLGILEEADIIWSSSDNSIITIDNQGLAMALSPGNVLISASFLELIDSEMVEAGEETEVLVTQRTASFLGLNNYTIKGSCSLSTKEVGGLLLTFSDDFKASNGPGIYVYLSNSDRGITGGFEVGKLISINGRQEYDIPEEITLNMFNYVIIYCKPFGIPFGVGELVISE